MDLKQSKEKFMGGLEGEERECQVLMTSKILFKKEKLQRGVIQL